MENCPHYKKMLNDLKGYEASLPKNGHRDHYGYKGAAWSVPVKESAKPNGKHRPVMKISKIRRLKIKYPPVNNMDTPREGVFTRVDGTDKWTYGVHNYNRSAMVLNQKMQSSDWLSGLASADTLGTEHNYIK